ncbi:MAG: hypothetical protein ACUVS2_02545 [Candidatus Flexifilum sp.]
MNAGRWLRQPGCLILTVVGLLIALLLIALASGAPLPEGWMLSTGPLP